MKPHPAGRSALGIVLARQSGRFSYPVALHVQFLTLGRAGDGCITHSGFLYPPMHNQFVFHLVPPGNYGLFAFARLGFFNPTEGARRIRPRTVYQFRFVGFDNRVGGL